MKKSLLTLILSVFSLIAFSQNNFRDVVYLKNGSIIKGTVTEIVPDKHIKIATADGSIFVYVMAEIDKMSKEEVAYSRQQRISERVNYSHPTAQGSFFISGSTNLGYASIKDEFSYSDVSDGEEFKRTADLKKFNFNPSVGWFVLDGLAIGLSINYKSKTYEYTEDHYYEKKESAFLYGPTIIYYFGKSKLKPFIEAEYTFGKENEEVDSNLEYMDSETKINNWSMGAGIAYFLRKNISANIGLIYEHSSGNVIEKHNYPIMIDEKKQSGTSLSAGFSFYF